jgi:hypothetical protein
MNIHDMTSAENACKGYLNIRPLWRRKLALESLRRSFRWECRLESYQCLTAWLLGGQGNAQQLGLPSATVKAAVDAMRWSRAAAFQHLCYAVLSFSDLAIVCSALIRDVTYNIIDNVALTLRNERRLPKLKRSQRTSES